MASKSFYELDYIIEINEKRIEQYLHAYQKVSERFTNIILIYSAITIFLIPIIQDVLLIDSPRWYLCICLGAFALLFLTSLIFTIRLIFPVNVAYLQAPDIYYYEYRKAYEQTIEERETVIDLLKASYIKELEATVVNNESVFRRKNSFYYNALMFTLLSVIPYLICLGFHISTKKEHIQKMEIVNTKNIRNL